ncbi:fasciclin-like arabinogalactan protein 11 [Andrographis paniculata]|uniref:fasciclin-like arabinogalactan protein 11 n=1 Tax=Andrographis paniculata TaxID=175694 RepID=UPI0021E8C354|nr:fasciclin-like arabinogalactan protein 11 [Andrographis paniculata]
MDQFRIPLTLATVILLSSTMSRTLAQAPAPAPSGPTNITKILDKAGQFKTLIRLFQITQIGDQINTQLNNSKQAGLTLFAPTDAAFSGLPSGTLNSLSDQQKVSLIQFHILPTFLSMSQFQTVSNPLRTQAGDSAAGAFPLNVTTSGNQVNISTGVNQATLANAIYTDNQLAVYQVDKVLLPLSLFGSPAPAPAPTAGGENSKKKSTGVSSPVAGGDSPADTSDAGGSSVRFGVVRLGLMAVLVYKICFL